MLRDERIKRQWQVDLPAFSISRYPVTQAQYALLAMVVKETEEPGSVPVTMISWLEAATFCNLLSAAHGLEPSYVFNQDSTDATLVQPARGYRLPSEAEWEYACRAGSSGPRYGELDKIAWYKANSGGSARGVGQKAPNAWGLYDMLGNVWEWCNDIYDPDVYGSYRVFRGGGWADEERGVLSTNRRRSHPTFAIDDLGFRVAL